MDSVPLRGGRCYHTTTTHEIQCHPHLLAQNTRCKRTVLALQSTRAAVPTIAEDIAAHHGIRVNLTAASATAVPLTAEQPTWMRPRRQRRQSNTISQHADEVHLNIQQEDPSSTLHYQHEHHHHHHQQQQHFAVNPSQQLLYIPRGFEDVVASEARRLGVLLQTVDNSHHVSPPVSTTDATSKPSVQPQQQQQHQPQQRGRKRQQQQQQEAQQQCLNEAASSVQHDTQLPHVPLQLPQQPQRQRRHKQTAVQQLELTLPQQDATFQPTQQQQQQQQQVDVLQPEQQQQHLEQPIQQQQQTQKRHKQLAEQAGVTLISEQTHWQQPEQHSSTQQQQQQQQPPAQLDTLLQQESTSAQYSPQHHQQRPRAAAQPAQQVHLSPPPPPSAAAASEAMTAATAAAAAPAKWQLAVSKRLAAAVDGPSMSLIRQARYSRLRSTSSSSAATKPRSSRAAASAGHNQPASASAAAAVGGQLTTAQGLPQSPALPTTQDISTDENLSTAAEGQLCEMYQKYLKLCEQLSSADDGDGGDHQQVDRLSLLHEAAAVQSQGLMAQQLLLELYQPMIINRTKRILGLHPNVDERELREALSRAVLTAAAKFDQNKAGKNAKLSSLAAVYIKNAIRDLLYEYQSAPVVVPYSVRQLSHKLQRVEKQLTPHHGGRAPTDDQLAAALGVPVAKVQEMRQAVAFQSSSLLEAGGDADDADADAAQQSGALNLLTLDVSQSQDELDYIPGAVRYARSGTEEERQLADESRALADVMQRFLLGLEPKDRTLLALRLGLISPDSLPDIAADVINHNNGNSSSSSSTTNTRDSQAVGKTSRKKATRSKKKEKEKKYTSLLAKIPELDEGILLQSLDSIDSLETSEGLSVAELSRLFDMPRQRGHQLMERVVKKMKQQLQETAGSNAELAMLLTAAGSRL